MIDQELPAEDYGDSTALDTGTNPDASNLDGELEIEGDFLGDLLKEVAGNEPPADSEEDDSNLEVSEDEEATPSDDDSNIEEGEETEEPAESSEENTPDSIVDEEEMKEHLFSINGKAYSLNDLKSALGRQAKQEEARKEVETAQAKLKERQDRVEQMESLANDNLQFIQKRTELAAVNQQLQSIVNAQEEAANQNDGSKWQQLEMQRRKVEDYLNKEGTQLQAAQEDYAKRNNEAQIAILKERGMGDILSDAQRQKALSEYVQSIHPSVVNMVDTNAYLFELAEKARLYDAAQSTGKQRKLKGNSKKTLKGGAGGPKPKAKAVDSFQESIDKLFKT